MRTIVQACHLNFLVGAGTPSAFFDALGDVENALTAVASSDAEPEVKAIARASIQACFFHGVVEPNVELIRGADSAKPVLRSYANFGRTLNHLLLTRRSSLLNKKVNVFTTNVDLAFEASFERLGLELNDGFSGKLRPSYDPGLFGALRYRTGARYEHRAEVPTFDLHKLHGSVGWQLSSDPGVASGIVFDTALADVAAIRDAIDSIDPRLPEVSSEIDPEELLIRVAKMKSPPVGLEAFEAAYGQLVIVNPEKQKFASTVLTETYYELIRRFANELERENSVLFVHGFSFRDEHLRKIVVRAARTNPTLQVIVFCYSRSGRDALATLVPDHDVPNTNVEYVTPAGDENDRLPLDEVVGRYFAPLSTTEKREPDDQIERLFDGERGS